jgi:integrase
MTATTGMRRSELLGLIWRQVDLEAARLSVVRVAVELGALVTYGEPKTPRSRRQVALDSETARVLRAWRRRQAEERLAFGEGWDQGDAVFTREDGVPIRGAWVSRRFAALAATAGLPPIRFHDLRHSHATLALAAGIHPRVVADRLGHASVKTTLDTYSYAVPALEEEAPEKVAALVLGA